MQCSLSCRSTATSTWGVQGHRYSPLRAFNVLTTGWDDQCLGSNQHLDHILNTKGIPHKLYIWGTYNSHDWPTWMMMVNEYL